jgi:mediator of RNA polymerase II transcription subunit 7
VYYLKKIVQSLMVNFLELIDVLSKNPKLKDEKLQDIIQLFKNAHKLINDYRPHQARETLILMMEEQLEKRRVEVADIMKMKERIEEILGGFKEFQETPGMTAEDNKAVAASKEMQKRKDQQRRAWQALEDEMVT